MIAFEAPVLAVPSLPELLHWSDQENLLQFELHLTGKAESIYKVLPPEEKSTFAHTTGALGKRVQPAKREAHSSVQMLRRQRPGGVDDFVRELEWLFEWALSGH